MSPTERSLKKLRGEGWICARTEHWNAYAKVRQDLFGFIDILAMKRYALMAVQTTSGSNFAARKTKIRSLDAAKVWAAQPNRLIVVHGWRKVGPRGGRKVWECLEEQIPQWEWRETVSELRTDKYERPFQPA